jgi:type I restriction enzyme S subunit
VQANLKRYRAAVLKAACSGQLVPTEAELCRERLATKNTKKHKNGDQPTPDTRHLTPEFETGEELLERILEERRKNWAGRGKYKEPAAPDTANLSPLPEGWGVASLEAISDVIDPNPSHRMPKYIPDGIPLVSTENFVGTEEIDFGIGKQVARETLEQQRSRYTIEEGDFVLSRIGTIGKTRFLPIDKDYCLSHALVFLKVRSKSINKRWLRKIISSESILAQAHKGVQSVGVPDLGMAKIREFTIPLPPHAEQVRIVAEVERRLSVVEELEAVVSANLQRATRLRQSILQKAFEGELNLCAKHH